FAKSGGIDNADAPSAAAFRKSRRSIHPLYGPDPGFSSRFDQRRAQEVAVALSEDRGCPMVLTSRSIRATPPGTSSCSQRRIWATSSPRWKLYRTHLAFTM